MKKKTLARIHGAAEAGLFGYFCKECYDVFSNIDPQRLGDFFLGEEPIEYKIIGGAYLATIAGLAPISAFFTVDGLVDLTKGTHHYFGKQVWKRFSRLRDKLRERR